MIANIQNGQLAKKVFIEQKKNKFCETILNVLWDEGFILGYKIDNRDPAKLRIFLKYTKNKPVIQTIKSISKPGSRVYYSLKQLWKIDSSTLRHRVTSEKLTDGVDYKKSGKVWLITKSAMERLYGVL